GPIAEGGATSVLEEYCDRVCTVGLHLCREATIENCQDGLCFGGFAAFDDSEACQNQFYLLGRCVAEEQGAAVECSASGTQAGVGYLDPGACSVEFNEYLVMCGPT
ncbi:MAG TPA: hypothetical protein VER33_16970, partial [Polyangiaceae bacterium]|nr:hypothetical protein [Polyangiaceae bacterium]